MAARHTRQYALEQCPTCGHLVRPRSQRFPHVRGPVTMRMLEIIADNPGIGGKDLIARLYADDPHGGPSSHQIIGSLIANVRKRLRLDGYQIESSRGVGGGYRIRELRS